MFEIILSRNAEKYYNNSDENLTKRLNEAFDVIVYEPFSCANIKKLKGNLNGLY